MGMRRGGCARRAMLGAVAAGALLGAARGYNITLDAGEASRDDDEYKVVTTAGLEIVIGPKDGNEYDIASAVPSSNDNNLAVGIAVVGGENSSETPAIIPSNCPGGITLDASTGNIACYGVERDSTALVTNEGGSITVANAVNNVAERTAFDNWWGTSFAGVIDFDVSKCPGDIDFDVINNVITCYAGALGGAAVVENTGGTVTVTATPGVGPGTALECLGGIVFDQENDKLSCYPKTDGVRDEANVVESDAFDANSGTINVSVSGTNNPTDGFFAICPGDIDLAINGDITCYDVDGALPGSRGAALVTNTDGVSITVSNGDIPITPSSCPGGITLDEDEGKIFCYNVARDPTPLVTNVAGSGDSGSIVVTETSETDAALQEKTTIAGASNTITVNGGADLETEGINYKIELNTDDGAFTKTVTTTTSEDANGVKTDTVTTVVTTNDVEPGSDPATETTEEVTETVTAPNAEIAGLLSGIEAPDSFAAGTVITIVRKSADDDGELKLETEYVKTELTEDESVTTTFFLTGDDSLPDPDGGEIDVTAGKYLDLFEEELSSSPTVATYRNRLPAGGKLPESFKNGEEIKGEAILKFEIEGTSNDTLFEDPSRLALTANLTTQVSGGTSRKLLQQEGVTQKETEFRSQIDDDDNIEESLKEVEKDADGKVIRFSANETKIEEDPKTGFITLTEIETVNGGTEEQVVTENELVLTSIGGSITVVSQKTTVDGQETFCDPPFAIVCGGSGSAPAPSPDNGGGGGGGPAPVPSPDNGGGG